MKRITIVFVWRGLSSPRPGAGWKARPTRREWPTITINAQIPKNNTNVNLHNAPNPIAAPSAIVHGQAGVSSQR